jgi:hypothetical protein
MPSGDFKGLENRLPLLGVTSLGDTPAQRSTRLKERMTTVKANSPFLVRAIRRNRGAQRLVTLIAWQTD